MTFAFEFGKHPGRLITWDFPARLATTGGEPDDRARIDSVIGDINRIARSTLIRRGNVSNAEIVVQFVPRSKLGMRNGSGTLHWDRNFRIRSAKVLIRDDLVGDRRSHVIREEIVQSLGLLKDTNRTGSIFFQGYSSVTSFSSADSALIRLIPAVSALRGADQKEVRRYLTRKFAVP